MWCSVCVVKSSAQKAISPPKSVQLMLIHVCGGGEGRGEGTEIPVSNEEAALAPWVPCRAARLPCPPRLPGTILLLRSPIHRPGSAAAPPEGTPKARSSTSPAEGMSRSIRRASLPLPAPALIGVSRETGGGAHGMQRDAAGCAGVWIRASSLPDGTQPVSPAQPHRPCPLSGQEAALRLLIVCRKR